MGTLSSSPLQAAMTLACERRTPLGSPVDPLVYIITAMSVGSGIVST